MVLRSGILGKSLIVIALCQKGYSFDINPQDDFLPRGSGVGRISNQHICFSFTPKYDIVLNDTSQYGTTVSYGGEGGQEPRKDFTWILDLYKDCCSKQKDVVVEVGNLRFMIEFPNHQNCKSEYEKNVDDFLRKGHANVLTLNVLDINTVQDTATENEKPTKPNTLSKDPLYV